MMKRVLTSLLRLLPLAFRREFGDEIREQIERDYDEARRRGRLAALHFAFANGADLVRTAIAERFNPTWTTHNSVEQPEMIWERNGWTRDIRHAMRSLLRSPGFTVVAVGTLGLAMGVNAAMFSVIDHVLLRPLPFNHADRIVTIAGTAPGSGLPKEFGLSDEFFVQYKEQSKLIEDIAAYNSFTSTLRVGDRIERVRMSMPTNSLYSTLGARPILGRLPVAEDGELAAVISYQLWKTWFAGDSGVVGRSFSISYQNRTIVGVMGPEFKFPNDATLLWISADIQPARVVPGRFGTRYVARMKAGTSTDDLANELTAISKTLPQRFGGSANYAKIVAQHRAVVKSLSETMFGSVAQPLWVLLGAVIVVLLIACANVGNLFAVRGEGRQRDLAVRRAIGAGRGQLIQSQMAEAIVVAFVSAIAAALIAWATLPIFLRAAPGDIPRIAEVKFDLSTLGFTLAAAALAAVACGLIPAIRGAEPDLTRLREGTRSTRTRNWGRDVLVIGQTALALVLLIGAGLLVRSFAALKNVKPGYNTTDIFTFQIAPDTPDLRDGPTFAQFDLNFLDRLKSLPGVESVGLVENIPLDEGTTLAPFRTESMADDANLTQLNYTFTAGDYFTSMGIRLRRGRTFDRTDHSVSGRNVIISQSAAELLWPGKDPIGQRIKRQGLDSWETVVGVVDDVMQNDFRTKPDPLVYFPLVGPTPTSWVIGSPAFVIKTRRAETIAPEVRALVKQVAPTAPMYRIYTMAGLARTSMIQLSFTMLTLLIVSTLALILGAVGLYGVLSYVVAQRTREIGVRMALGAEASAVRRMVVGQGARVVGIGVAIGIVAALLTTRALSSLLFDVNALDITTFAAMSTWMLVIGLIASYVPALRASRVDPIESLRGE